jgi:hypothetical protein
MSKSGMGVMLRQLTMGMLFQWNGGPLPAGIGFARDTVKSPKRHSILCTAYSIEAPRELYYVCAKDFLA